MEKIKFFGLFLILTLSMPLTAFGIRPIICLTAVVYRYISTSHEKEEENPHRTPTPFQCTISKDQGVRILSVAPDDIERYEIYDTSGICLGVFGEQEDFISSLFSRTGTFEVRFYTTEYLFVGEIEIGPK